MASADLLDPIFMQGVSYNAQADRKAFQDIFGSGIISAGDFALALTSGLSFNIAPGAAWVKGLNVADQGSYRFYETATKSLTLTAAHATLPRLDQVVLRAHDQAHDTSGVYKARVEVIDGTATSGATLVNRNGAANLTALSGSKSVVLLHDILLAPADTTLASGDVVDRRTLATIGGGSVALDIADTVPRVAAVQTSTVDVVNTVTETPLVSYSVPGGTLGTQRALLFMGSGDILDNGSDAYTVRTKYGATTLDTTGTISVADSGTRRPFSMRVILQAMGSTSSQRVHGTYSIDGSTAVQNEVNGTSAIDSTTTQTFQVTAQWDGADVNSSFRLLAGILVLL